MMRNARHFLGLFVAFTLGAMCAEIKSQREIGALRVDVLGAYYDGKATCEVSLNTEHLHMATAASSARHDVTLVSNPSK